MNPEIAAGARTRHCVNRGLCGLWQVFFKKIHNLFLGAGRLQQEEEEKGRRQTNTKHETSQRRVYWIFDEAAAYFASSHISKKGLILQPLFLFFSGQAQVARSHISIAYLIQTFVCNREAFDPSSIPPLKYGWWSALNEWRKSNSHPLLVR